MKKRIILKTTIQFSLTVAKRYHNTSYYEAQADNNKSLEFREREKLRLSTKKSQLVTKLINKYKALAVTQEIKVLRTLEKIKEKMLVQLLTMKNHRYTLI